MKPLVQVVLGLAICVVVLVIWLLSPVCVRIHEDELPAFETVRSLDERAALGEPFEKKDGGWYQCKSRLARAFF